MDDFNQTIIKTAEVSDRTDASTKGTFKARVKGIDQEQSVFYVSPYGSSAKAGMIAVPERLTPIMVCSPAQSNQWFYMGSLFSLNLIQTIRTPTPLLRFLELIQLLTKRQEYLLRLSSTATTGKD